jgi:transposase-like protein
MTEPKCPFCNATVAELLSLFGSQLLLSQYRCRACGSYFEGLREDRIDFEVVGPAAGGTEDDGS